MTKESIHKKTNSILLLAVFVVSAACTLIGQAQEQSIKSYAYAVAWSPDGGQIVALRSNEIQVLDASTLSALSVHRDTLVQGTSSILSGTVVFSSDGTTYATADLVNGVRLWRSSDHQEIRTLSNSIGVTSLAFTPSGKMLVGAGIEAPLGIWDVESGRLIETFIESPSAILSIALSSSGELLATGELSGQARLWRLAGFLELKKFEGFLGPVSSVTFSQRGDYMAAASSGHEVRIIDPENKVEKYSFVSPSIGVEKENRFFQSLVTAVLVLGAARTAQLTGAPAGFPAQAGQISEWQALNSPVRFSPDGKYVAFIRSSYKWPGRYSLEVHETETGKFVSKNNNGRSAIAFSPNGEKLVISDLDRLKIIDLRSGVELRLGEN